MKKIIIWVVGIIVVAVIAWFVVQQYSPKAEAPTGGRNDQSKLNIDEVCRGALAYMTFGSGAEAEVFVGECKEGKHPEVIEKYKKDRNLDGATI